MENQDLIKPTHQCKECGALWKKWPQDDSLSSMAWTLVSEKCDVCCANGPTLSALALIEDPTRINPQDIEANIASEHYFTAAQGSLGAGEQPAQVPPSLHLLTFCILVLKNGFTVVGQSACVHPENFDAQLGRAIARKNALNDVWPLMGYELRSKIAAVEV